MCDIILVLIITVSTYVQLNCVQIINYGPCHYFRVTLDILEGFVLVKDVYNANEASVHICYSYQKWIIFILTKAGTYSINKIISWRKWSNHYYI